MADKSIDQLNAAEKIYDTDLFVLQQSGSAKKLTGRVLLNWLTAAADGHGGIQSIAKLSTSGLVDTYRITLADTTIFDFAVTNGRSITDISKTSTSGLVDTYTISYNNGTTSKFTVTNGEKGDKGDNAYVWIKYASQEPTESSHSIGDIPDDWLGIYSGNASTAPTDWKQYQWFKHKGEKGDTGTPATLVTRSVTYQVSDSGTIIPSGAWGASVPVVAQGKYLWTKTETQFNTGDPIVSYSVARMGIDGSGSVSSVAGVSPDEAGNVPLTAADVGALPSSGGDMTGAINMNGQPVSGLNPPTEDTQAANKGYVDAAKAEAISHANAAARAAAPRNLLDNSDFRNPVNQRGQTSYSNNFIYTIDRWQTGDSGSAIELQNDGVKLYSSDGSQNFYIFQRVKKMCAGTYTFAAKFHGNTGIAAISSYATDGLGYIAPSSIDESGVLILVFIITEDINSDFAYFRLQSPSVGSSVVWEWAALYEGTYTAETLPEYQPKGYGAELAECKRYAEVINTGVSQFCHPYNATVSAFSVEYAEKRIKNPTITMLGSLTRAVIVPGVGTLDPTSIEFVYPIGAKSVRMNVFGTFDTSKVYAVDYNIVKLFISADL